MKVIAIDCSPPFDSSRAVLILTPFVSGMKSEGADVTLLSIDNLRLAPFAGDLEPLMKPRKRGQKDEFAALLAELEQADVWVLASPLYAGGMSGQMKNLLDRIVSTVPLRLALREGRSRQKIAATPPGARVVLVATSFLWESDEFNAMIASVESFCDCCGRRLAAVLLRPHSAALTWLIDRGLPVADVFQAAYTAGQEMARTGFVTPQTRDTVGRQLVPLDLYVQLFNERQERRQAAVAAPPVRKSEKPVSRSDAPAPPAADLSRTVALPSPAAKTRRLRKQADEWVDVRD